MEWLKYPSSECNMSILLGLAWKCSLLGGPQAKELYELFRSREFLKVINFDVDYNGKYAILL